MNTLGSRDVSPRWDHVTYFVEGVDENHLAIGVGNAREGIQDGSVSLLKNLLLSFRDGLGDERIRCQIVKLVCRKGRFCLVDYCLEEMVPDSVHLAAEGLGRLVDGRLCFGTSLSKVLVRSRDENRRKLDKP